MYLITSFSAQKDVSYISRITVRKMFYFEHWRQLNNETLCYEIVIYIAVRSVVMSMGLKTAHSTDTCDT